MAARSKQQFEYIAHILVQGECCELVGKIEETDVHAVYRYLMQRAAEMAGFLLNQEIKPVEEEVEEEPPFDVIRMTSAPASNSVFDDDKEATMDPEVCGVVYVPMEWVHPFPKEEKEL